MFQQKTKIRYSEADSTGRLSMEGLLRLFQDLGYQHALERGLGVRKTLETGHTWYLLSWRIDLLNPPIIGEEVTLDTWFYEMKGPTARKNILMKDSQGNPVAKADTMWVYIDVATQSPIIPEDNMWPEEDFGKPLAWEKVSRRIPGVSAEKGIELPKVNARDYLIDTNHHANNVKLTLYAMTVAGADFGCNSLRVEFKNQVPPGAELYPFIETIGDEIRFVFRDGNGTDYASFLFCLNR